MVLEKSRKRFNKAGLPKSWRGPRWHGPLSAAEQDEAQRKAAVCGPRLQFGTPAAVTTP